MISNKMRDSLNGQVNAEYYSSYLYLSMSAYFQSLNFKGFAHWMRVQAQEELGHSLKFYDYVVERGGRVTLKAIEAPPTEWASPLKAFEAAYEHERKVTGLINGLVNQAVAEGDHATNVFLNWFVSEQVEEEASVDAVVQILKMVGDHYGPLFMLDHRLGERK